MRMNCSGVFNFEKITTFINLWTITLNALEAYIWKIRPDNIYDQSVSSCQPHSLIKH